VERLDGVTLAVAGPERDRELAARLRSSTRCRVLGRVDAPTLELLYQRAKAVVVPSLYEGFGLPVLEAMTRSQVVVAARSSSLPEVGGEAVLYVDDPNDPVALGAVLETALGDQKVRARLKRAAPKRAADFTWDRTAAGVAEVVRELVR
jgi:alpha-1,3-rhamnosyl/mannosyltransferase